MVACRSRRRRLFVLERIRETAAAQPLKLALVFNGAPVTYGGFWRLIAAAREALAPHLPDRGVAILWVDSLLESWVLDLALRSLGLDTASIRTEDQIALFDGIDVACMVTLASERSGEVAAAAHLRRVSLSDPSAVLMTASGPLPPAPDIVRRGGHIALTSGTTGRYKKVLRDYGASPGPIEQRAARYAELGDDIIQQDETSVLNIFNMALWSAGGYSRPVLTWCLKGAVVFDQRGDLARALEWPGITHTTATPAYLSQLMAAPEGSFAFRPQMQLIVVSGSLTPVLARETMRRLTPRILINLSSTEAGGWARTVVRTMDDLRWYRLEPGRRVEVVDDADQPLPPHRLGRVRVALREDNAGGYVGDLQTSAATFAGGWFYPGDLGMLDGAGRLALYGRTTDVVPIDGVKQPAELWERALQERLECEAVCVISAGEDEEQLHVFIETRRPIAPQAVAEALRATLTDFARFQAHLVDALPRTPTGKVRRIELAQRLHEGAFEPGATARC